MKHLKIFLLLFLLNIIVSRSFAQDTKVVFDNNATIDFGKIPLKSKTEKVIYFVNNSNRPFIITSAETSCGCTKVSYNKRPVQSMSKDSVIVRFDAKETGAFYKKILIKNNLPQGDIPISIKGTVVK